VGKSGGALPQNGRQIFCGRAHPFAYVFDRPTSTDDLKLVYPYSSPKDQPITLEVTGSYADKEAKIEAKSEHSWNHSLSDIIGGLLKAGFKITDFQEYHHCVWEMFPGMVSDENNNFYLTENADRLPLMFSITATK
jgi:hypothetical protein